MLRVVLVGCGKAAENHVREIQTLSGASLVAVSDIEPLMAEQLAIRYGIPTHYADIDAMLHAERPDIVHIATPPQSHLPLAMKALDAGCHIFVEKPLTTCYSDSQKLVGHAISCNRKLTTAYGYYFDPIARTLRTLAAEGVLGDTVHIESFFGYALQGPFGSSVFADSGHWVHQLPGKLVHNVIDHLLNKIAEYVSEQATVHARAWQRSIDRHPTCSMPDELRVLILDADTSGFATFTSHAQPVAHSLKIFGTKNTACLDFEAGTITLATRSALPGALGRLGRTFGQGFQYLGQGTKNVIGFARSEYRVLAGLNFLIGTFYDSIRHDGPVPIPYGDILKVAAMTEAVFTQLRESQAITV